MTINMIDRLKQFFDKKSEFFNHVVVLLSGTVLAQMVPVVISPVLSRLYTPENFGLFAFMFGIVMILVPFFNGRYDAAIIVPRKEAEAFLLFKLTIYISLFMLLVVSGAITLLFEKPTIVFSMGKNEHLLYLLPVTALFFSFYMTCDFFLNRHKQYKKISTIMIFRVLIVSVFQIVLGIFYEQGLLYGLVFGMFFVSGIQVWYVYPYFKGIATFSVQKVAKKYQNYPLYHMPHTFFNALSNHVPVLLLSYLFTLSETGIYMMALKVFYTPFSMLGSSIEKVFRKQIVDALHHNEKIETKVKTMLYKVVVYSLIPFIFLVWLAPSIFTFILGSAWGEVGRYIQILSPWIYLAFVVSMFVGVPIVLEEQKKSLMIEIVYFLLRTVGLLIGAVLYQDIYIALLLYSIGGSMVICYNLFWIYALVKKSRGSKI